MPHPIPAILSALLLGFLCFGQAPTPGKAADMRLDGRLDEAAWQGAPPQGAFKWLAVREKSSSPAKTEFRLLADETTVWLGIRLEEPNMAGLKTNAFGRDNMGTFSQDLVEIFFDPEGKGNTYYQYAVSAAGDQWDAFFIEKGNTTIGEYTANWDAAVRKGENEWSVEIRIPLSALYFTDSKNAVATWKLNVARERQQGPELSTWSPLQKGFHEPDRFLRVAGMPIKGAKHDLRITSMESRLTGQDVRKTTNPTAAARGGDQAVGQDVRQSWVRNPTVIHQNHRYLPSFLPVPRHRK